MTVHSALSNHKERTNVENLKERVKFDHQTMLDSKEPEVPDKKRFYMNFDEEI